MKNSLLLLALLPASFAAHAQQAHTFSKSTSGNAVLNGFFIEPVKLTLSGTPEVKVTDKVYTLLEDTAKTELIQKAGVAVDVGIERKHPVAMVRVPAYRRNDAGQWEVLSSYTLTVIEKEATANNSISDASNPTARTTTASTSVLASGSWQKIAVAERGVYKVDYDFVSSKLGKGGSINSTNIRLFGNGGTMLPESNKVAHPDDLVENPIEMHDGGDGIFNAGDYFLFYANGPVAWLKDSVNQGFIHLINLYADASYYFITFDNGAGLRISDAAGTTKPATTNVSTYNEYASYEKEQYNLGLFGKTWWGDMLNFSGTGTNEKNIVFNLDNINDTVYYRYSLASAALGKSGAAAFYVSLNGTNIGSHTGIYGIDGSDGTDPAVGVFNSGMLVQSSSGTLTFNINYQKNVSSAKGYIDYVEVNTRRTLKLNSGGQIVFRDWRSVAPGSVAQFNIQNADGNTRVWDVTDPLHPSVMQGNLSGSVYSFTNDADILHEYAAYGTGFMSPAYVGTVANQNLHGLAQTDYIIVSHPDLTDAANKLAEYHRNNSGLSVTVVTTDQVYNEFGSGAKDISAIRDFVRMFYKRAGSDESQLPKYLLLMGQASFDYKDIIPNTAKLVPTYETPESLSATSGYCSDDFYALLDDNEYIHEGFPLMDIGVGRIPATNAAEASAVVDKIIRYKSNCSLGPWRLNNIYVADKEDGGGDHLLDADAMYTTVTNSSDIYNAQKVYLDNLDIISTPAGFRCPDANKIINDNMYKGAFLMNYSGHGSIYTLSSKRIVTQTDYNAWTNSCKMPIMITATCDFSRFDNPALQSSGEKIMLKSDGGAIALVTTTQVVYATYNRVFNQSYLSTQFQKEGNIWHTFGDAFRISKNYVIASGDTFNSRKFALLGDPALLPDFPRYNMQTDSAQEVIEGTAVRADTINSLGHYRIFGSVRDDNNIVMSDFNGKAYVTIFDKRQIVSVKTDNSSEYRRFITQNNIIYKGTATVTNGVFNFDFIAPKDVNYDFGKGKISYYAENGSTDAAGNDTNMAVGGFSEHYVLDEDSPVIRPFMNDSLFKNGGLTGTNSILYAIITDESGINVSGNYVGHDLSAILDNNEETPYVLNDYYETAPNTYKRGYVSFPISGLSDGMHSLKITAWDVFNNSGSGIVVFEVANGSIVKIRNIYSYPNPFRETTKFVFEHNHPNEELTATINIYDMAGSLVRTLSQTFTPTGSNSADIVWDGTGNGGEKLNSGVYMCRIKIATSKNIEDMGYQKVVLIR
ncbi:type IX secretion system sortase PorU [Rurimicrobium arvi]|uniref:Type IX secretion system sortase PorU n=1 Tax=Rurimicrobium arvi TaxID=2049916 RepID=A0ABP8MI69_9BACT